MTAKRTILLIGRTGSGKSTIANVISNTNRFGESEYSVSQTRDIQIGHFKLRSDGTEYVIIDTIGIGDTKLSLQEVLGKLADASWAIKDGLNQILFVTSERFTEAEVMAYDLLRTVIFDENVVKYTTIVRTKFPSFRKPEKCREDREKMLRENETMRDIVEGCKKVIHVNNLTEEEDPRLEARADSRLILRTYLRHCQDVYKPSNLNELNERIGGYMTEKERLEQELREMRRKGEASEEMLRRLQRKFDSLNEQIISQMAQQIQKKDPGFFQEVGA